jgi:glycine cleavage system H protein
MTSPSDRLYSDSHEWHKVEGDTLTLGLTTFAVNQLTDVTYVEMKPPGTTIEPGDSLGEVESVKATSDVYCACPGEIIETNAAVAQDPSLLNTDPFNKGWLVKVRIADKAPLDSLMPSTAYDQKYAD